MNFLVHFKARVSNPNENFGLFLKKYIKKIVVKKEEKKIYELFLNLGRNEIILKIA